MSISIITESVVSTSKNPGDWVKSADLTTLDFGTLEFPFGILREFGELSRTLAALYSLKSVQETGQTDADLVYLSQRGCVPVGTLKMQIQKLERLQVLTVKRRARSKKPSIRRIDLELIRQNYGKANKNRLRVPRRFMLVDRLEFREAILLAYYRYTCIRNGGTRISYCYDTLDEIQQKIGFSVPTWKRARKELRERGLIECKTLDRGNLSIHIPGYKPDHKAGTNPKDISKRLKRAGNDISHRGENTDWSKQESGKW